MPPLSPHPDRARLESLFRGRADIRAGWAGTAYRGARPRYARDPDFLSGQGSKIAGGRWNPPDSCRTIYACTAGLTVLKEAFAASRRAGIPDSASLPVTIRSFECTLQEVVDLSDPAIQTALGLNMRALLAEDWLRPSPHEAHCQAVGHEAFRAGIEGLLVPSAADPHDTNLVVFVDNLLAGSTLRPGSED